MATPRSRKSSRVTPANATPEPADTSSVRAGVGDQLVHGTYLYTVAAVEEGAITHVHDADGALLRVAAGDGSYTARAAWNGVAWELPDDARVVA